MPECRSRLARGDGDLLADQAAQHGGDGGVSRSHMPVSQTSAKSALSSACVGLEERLEAEGSRIPPRPRTASMTLQGRSPCDAFQARQASTKVISWPLSSDAPRAGDHVCAVGLRRHERGSNGSVVPQLQRIDRLHVVMAVEQHMRAGLARLWIVGRRPSDGPACRARVASKPRPSARRPAIRPRGGNRPCRRGRSRCWECGSSRKAVQGWRRGPHRCGRVPGRGLLSRGNS